MRLFLAGIMLAGLVAACERSTAPETPPVSVSKQAEHAEQVRFTVETIGKGQDIILVPGLASHPETFQTTVLQLKDRYKLHLVHIAGFAGAPPAGNKGEDDILLPVAKDVAAYASGLETTPMIIGHSLGGLVAMAAALDAPNAFDRVLVIDVLPFFSVLMDPDATETSIKPVAAYLKSTLLSYSAEMYEIRQREALAALTKSEEALDKSLRWSLQTDREVMAEAMHDVLTTDMREEIGALEVPLTVLYAKDEAIPNMERVEKQFLEAYSVVSDVNIQAVDGALHFVMFDQPEQYSEQIKKFTETSPGRGDE